MDAMSFVRRVLSGGFRAVWGPELGPSGPPAPFSRVIPPFPIYTGNLGPNDLLPPRGNPSLSLEGGARCALLRRGRREKQHGTERDTDGGPGEARDRGAARPGGRAGEGRHGRPGDGGIRGQAPGGVCRGGRPAGGPEAAAEGADGDRGRGAPSPPRDRVGVPRRGDRR